MKVVIQTCANLKGINMGSKLAFLLLGVALIVFSRLYSTLELSDLDDEAFKLKVVDINLCLLLAPSDLSETDVVRFSLAKVSMLAYKACGSEMKIPSAMACGMLHESIPEYFNPERVNKRLEALSNQCSEFERDPVKLEACESQALEYDREYLYPILHKVAVDLDKKILSHKDKTVSQFNREMYGELCQ